MTPEKQIRALAELDGLGKRYSNEEKWKKKTVNFTSSIPNYLASYDAIIPLIQKGWAGGIDSYNGNGFTSCVLEKQWVKDCCDSCRMNGMLKLTPTQLCEALLRATGKWEDE